VLVREILTEIAKPKGVVDKNVGKPEKESKSGYKKGDRVAVYYGKGQTKHGDIENPDCKSGGKAGAHIKFGDGSRAWHPHSEIKKVSHEQSMKDFDDMSNSRNKSK